MTPVEQAQLHILELFDGVKVNKTHCWAGLTVLGLRMASPQPVLHNPLVKVFALDWSLYDS